MKAKQRWNIFEIAYMSGWGALTAALASSGVMTGRPLVWTLIIGGVLQAIIKGVDTAINNGQNGPSVPPVPPTPIPAPTPALSPAVPSTPTPSVTIAKPI